MKFIIVNISRFLVGLLFVFSGVIKMNDPVGFSFKLEEYFGEDVLNLPFLQPFALGFAVFIVIYEVILGITLILGIWKRITLLSLAGMMGFFTFLTFYSAYYEKVTDCGCFGDAIPLEPWESFGKDVILSVLIAILVFGRNHIQPFLSARTNRLVLSIGIFISVGFSYHVLEHLPVWDFRAYKPGTNVSDALKSAEDLGLDPPVYETYYTMLGSDGESFEISGTEYINQKLWEKPYTIDPDGTFSKKIKDGYEPPIHDFTININGRDLTQDYISGNVIWLVAYDFEKSNYSELVRLTNELSKYNQNSGFKVVGMTASSDENISKLVDETSCSFPWAVMDGTALKTINRSNPGITILENGVIARHQHFNDAFFNLD